MSILEIDAASNNRVEDIRELRDTILIPPQGSKKKVYIIDEVHMPPDPRVPSIVYLENVGVFIESRIAPFYSV